MLFDLFENRNGVGNGLFHSLTAVSVDLGLVDFTVGQTAGTADAAADAGHTFDKVCVELALALLRRAIRQVSIPSQETALSSKSCSPCSLSP